MLSSHNPDLFSFLPNFTLGFADGLTVPFALTAGLSLLGKSDTVIYAGLAELCAGSISMGIGGYLAAVDEPSVQPSSRKALSEVTDDNESQGMLMCSIGSDSAAADDKSLSIHEEELIVHHLVPLGLVDSTVTDILNSMRQHPGSLQRAARQIQANYEGRSNVAANTTHTWPVLSGLSVSLGYIVGGIIPLVPYVFASTVGIGLAWSIVLCLVALMLFGVLKSLALDGRERNARKAFWSGMQMLMLGSLAAVAAVACVHLVGGGEQPAP